jgi:hypothetical protein
MTTHDNLTEDQELHAAEDERRRYLRQTFGEDVFIGLATDPAPTGPGRSAQTMANARTKGLRRRRLEQAQEVNAEAYELEQDRDAYARTMNDRRAGRPSTSQDLLRAERYAKANGIVRPRSSAERLARQGR